ncbi:hypothetical protein CRG98_017887 [Punica granatum]|uniref:Malectin-like domain-containing protein n=1 Tax=Punica granatum TaxID=22663 RepID=A0A2I0K0R6_PUNGR|nr:hypothetical protein CRG98_017887 [Punica granatum]
MFHLEFNGKQWAAVSTSTVGPQHEELICTNPRESISVCLAWTQDGQSPFISMLELLPLPDGMYANMSSDTSWRTLYRYMYGATDSILGYLQDKYNRGWQPRNESDFGVMSLTADFTLIISTSVDYPPDPALLHAIMVPSAEFEFPLYFQDVYFYTVRPQYRNCTSFGIQFIDDPAVYLIPNKSDLPPIINSIEVYDSGYIHGYRATSQDDVDGSKAIIDGFEQLQQWSGACLPLSSSWQWLTCSEFYPTPNVTSMNLSGYGLQGHLPDFSQMRALKTM